MHLNPEGQEQAKLEVVAQAFQEMGLAEHVPTSMYTSDSWKYRHQIKLVVSEDRGAIKIGVRNRRNRLAPIPNCEVVTKQLKLISKRLAHRIIALSKQGGDDKIFAYSNEHPTGLRYIVARQSKTTQNIHICLVATHSKRVYTDLANWLLDSNLPVTGVSLHINDEPGNAIFQRSERGFIRTEVLRGNSSIEEEVNGIRYKIGVGDFFQVHPVVAGQLQRETRVSRFEASGL